MLDAGYRSLLTFLRSQPAREACLEINSCLRVIPGLAVIHIAVGFIAVIKEIIHLDNQFDLTNETRMDLVPQIEITDKVVVERKIHALRIIKVLS